MIDYKEINKLLLKIHNIFSDRNDTIEDVIEAMTKDNGTIELLRVLDEVRNMTYEEYKKLYESIKDDLDVKIKIL